MTDHEDVIRAGPAAIGQALAFSGDPRAAIPVLERDQEVRRTRLRSERLGMGFSRALFASALIAVCRATLGEFADARRALELVDRINSGGGRADAPEGEAWPDEADPVHDHRVVAVPHRGTGRAR